MPDRSHGRGDAGSHGYAASCSSFKSITVLHSASATASFIKDVCADIAVPYGMIYKCEKVSKAFSYAAGNNMVTMYSYENSSAFKKEVPGRFQGRERYKEHLLRMVYPVNVISNKHLEIDVGGVVLKDWIGRVWGEENSKL